MNVNSVHRLVQAHISAADVLALGLENAGLVAVGGWGGHTLGWTEAFTLPLVLAALRGTLLSPRASCPLTGLAWPRTKLCVFAACTFALNAVTAPVAAATFFARSLLSVTLGGTR